LNFLKGTFGDGRLGVKAPGLFFIVVPDGFLDAARLGACSPQGLSFSLSQQCQLRLNFERGSFTYAGRGRVIIPLI